MLAGPANILDTKPTSVTGVMDFSEEWTLDESIAAVQEHHMVGISMIFEEMICCWDRLSSDF